MKNTIGPFQSATGRVTGMSHQNLRYNGQDAYALYQDDGLIVGVVADGCGASPYSEVGARLGCMFVLEFCKRHFRNAKFDAAYMLTQHIEYLHQLCDLHLPSDRKAFIEQHLLYTIMGFVVTPTDTHVFHAGDGFIVINERTYRIDQDNRPRYVGNHLLGQRATFVTEHIPTHDLQQLLIGTDGLRDLPVPLNELLETESYFHNEVALPRYLHDQASAGQILDDVAVIMLKRPST